MQILENQIYWGGTLTLVVGFESPGLGDGIIRCATFPSSEGAELQPVRAEPAGEDRLISGLTNTLSEPFFVSQ